MTYEQALEIINGRLAFGIKPGLERISALLEALGNPHKNRKFVHIAGTNGKGTTSALIASALTESGLCTGLYTSPYVLDFRERFQIDGEMISPEEIIEETKIVDAVVREFEARGETITEFEFITALAFHWYASRGCDIVVLETGLGGRFDATNVIDVPEVAAIMSISLDHTAILGDTLEKIAFEKAGIIKAGGRVVLYPVQGEGVRQQMEAICQERGASLTVPDRSKVQELCSSLEGTEFQVGGASLFTPFLGEHQVNNALTACTVLEILQQRGLPITGESIARGFRKAFLPARMEIISHNPLCLLDGGHNPGCALVMKEALGKFVPQKRIAVMGMMSDKDSHEALRILGPLFSAIITYAPDNPRSLSAEALAETASEFCPITLPTATCGEALAAALKHLEPGMALIVCGSFFLASEIREQLMGKMKNLEG